MEIGKNRSKGKTGQIYSESFKLKVIDEVLKGEITKSEARRIYGIRSNNAILEWTRKYSGLPGFDSKGRALKNPSTPKLKDQLAKQNSRILKLEEALRIEKLKVALSNKMIDIAEEELGVDIRKKSGAKQSKSSKQKKGKK